MAEAKPKDNAPAPRSSAASASAEAAADKPAGEKEQSPAPGAAANPATGGSSAATPQSAANPEGQSAATKTGSARRAAHDARAYDFRRPKYLSAEAMKNIHRIHSGVAASIQERLTRYLGVNFDARVDGAEELAYGLLAEGIPAHSHALILDLAPLQDRGMLLLDSQICLAFVDRVLGGRSTKAHEPRPLTAMDQAATGGVVEIILRCFRDGWKDFCPVRMTVVDRRPAFDQVQFVTAAEPVLAVTLLLKGELGEGRLRLCVPVSSLRTMPLPGLEGGAAGDAAHALSAQPGPEKAAAIRAALTHSVEKASLPVVATVGATNVPLRCLLALGVGEVVRLDQPAEAPVLVSVGGRPAFLARMGLRGRWKAVQVVQRLSNEQSEGSDGSAVAPLSRSDSIK